MAEIDLDAGALAGFLTADPLLSDATLQAVGVGATDSSYTLGSPQPGRAVHRPLLTGASSTLGTRSPDLKLITSGSQKGDQRVMVSRAGLPGSDLAVVCADTSGAAPVWHGASQPHIIEDATADALDVGLDGPMVSGMAETDDGHVCVVWHSSAAVMARRWDPSALDWAAASVTVLDQAAAAASDAATPETEQVADVVRLSSGRLLAATVGQLATRLIIVTAWSDDHGITWRSASIGAADLSLPSSTDIVGLRLGYDTLHEAALLLLAITYVDGQSATRTGWIQYASADSGAAWQFIEDWSDGDSGSADAGRPAIITDPVTGALLVLDVVGTGVGTAQVRQRRIATPYASLRSTSPTIVASLASATLPDDVTAWADRTGALWAAWSPEGTAARVARSLDGGGTWAKLTTPLYDAGSAGLDRLSACSAGAAVVWMIADTVGGVRPDQIRQVIQTGGWQTLCQPATAADWPRELEGWARTWTALVGPVSAGYSNSGGAGTMAGAGDWRLDLSATPSTYGISLSHALTAGIIVHAEVSAVSGGNVSSLSQGLRLRLGGAEIQVRLSGSTLRLYDVAAAAQVGSDYTIPLLGSRYHLRIALREVVGIGYVSVYARARGDSAWALAVSGTVALTSGSADSLTWGVFAASGTMSSTWHSVRYTTRSGTAAASAAWTDDPSLGTALTGAPYTLPGATLPGASARLPLLGGLHLAATAGPGLRGETWDLPLADSYGPEHVLSRSPSQPWRSEDDSTAQVFAWSPAAGQAHHPGGRAVGLALLGVNFRTAHLELYSGGSWATVATLDLGSGLTGLSYTRTGDTIRVAAGSSTTTLQALDLIGATVDLGSGYLRRVGSATGGTWTSGSATATLRLDGITGAEPTSGTLDLWLTTGAAIRLGAVTAGTHWRLRIPAQDTVDGYLTVGRAVIGPVGVMIRYSRGRVVAVRPDVVLSEAPGRRTARRLAAPTRTVSLAWVEGVPTRRHLTAPAHLAGGGQPLVGAGDLGAIDALQHTHGGGLEPLVYLPRIAATSGASGAETVLALGRDLVIYGAPIGELSVENVEGDEVAREIVRVAGLTISEEA